VYERAFRLLPPPPAAIANGGSIHPIPESAIQEKRPNGFDLLEVSLLFAVGRAEDGCRTLGEEVGE
jgi:hypothetical protein